MMRTLKKKRLRKESVAQTIAGLLIRNRIGYDEVDDILDLAREKVPRNRRLKKETTSTNRLPAGLISP